MPRFTKPLTALEVKQAKLSDKPYELTDGKGLTLKVSKTSKRWLLKYYRPYDKKRTNIALGSYPEISLSDARALLADARVLLVKGIDPSIYRKKQQAISLNTFHAVTTEWLVIKKEEVTEDYYGDIKASLKKHIYPSLGNIPITDITAPLAISALKPLSVKGSNELIRKLCQRLNWIMTYAVNVGAITDNRLSGIKDAFVAPTATNYPTLKPEQLPELMQGVMNSSTTLVTKNLILFQLHTMTRPTESAGALWEEIDLDKRLWTISRDRMKKRKEHIVPLTKQTLAILKRMKEANPHSKYIFAGARNINKPANSSTANVALKRMGFKNRLVAHGLRSLASTTLNEKRYDNGTDKSMFDSELIEVSLAHVDSNTRADYNHAEYLEKRREMLGWWSEHIAQATVEGLML